MNEVINEWMSKQITKGIYKEINEIVYGLMDKGTDE